MVLPIKSFSSVFHNVHFHRSYDNAQNIMASRALISSPAQVENILCNFVAKELFYVEGYTERHDK